MYKTFAQLVQEMNAILAAHPELADTIPAVIGADNESWFRLSRIETTIGIEDDTRFDLHQQEILSREDDQLETVLFWLDN